MNMKTKVKTRLLRDDIPRAATHRREERRNERVMTSLQSTNSTFTSDEDEKSARVQQ